MWGDDKGVSYRVSYQPQEYYIEPPPSGGLKFSNEEKKHLLMAIGALTLAFTLLLRHLDLPIYLIAVLAFCSVMTGFFMHEMAHKYIAQKYGSWAEFRAWPQYLLIAIATAFFGFLFAAPGAVYHRGYLTKEQTGKVSAAGPVTNVVMASFILPIIMFIPGIPYEIFVLLWMVCLMNVIIGGFNLVPFFGLDGKKIIKWNVGIWLGLFAILGFYAVLLLFPEAIFG
jgi:Zn-dependent protease